MKISQDISTQSFGEYFRLRRVSLGYTLRSFSQQFGYDPGNISKIERDMLAPSLDKSTLLGYARALKIKPESEEWVMFHDLANLSKDKIPEDIANQTNSYKYFPLLFRTMRGKKLTREQLERLLDLINGKE